jgi:hypothetical protein
MYDDVIPLFFFHDHIHLHLVFVVLVIDIVVDRPHEIVEDKAIGEGDPTTTQGGF